jgi:hypothetical protein
LATALDFLLDAGFSREALARTLRSRADRVLRGEPLADANGSRHFELINNAASVLHDWWRDPAYVGSDGQPKPLPLQGRGASLSRLVARHFPKSRVPDVLAWMESAHVFKRHSDGLAHVAGRSVIVGGAGALTSERAATLAAQYLKTVMHNNRTTDNGLKNFDRAAHVRRLSRKHLRRFRELVTAQGEEFLVIIDNWLEEHQASEVEDDGVEVSVHVHVYSDERSESSSVTSRKPIS